MTGKHSNEQRAVTRRRLGLWLVLATLLLPAGTGIASDASLLKPNMPIVTQTQFDAVVAALWPDAERQGVSRTLFNDTFAGLTPDLAVAAMTTRQPEFAKPIGAYLAAQVTTGRVVTGRALSVRWAMKLDEIERRFGVPRDVVLAIWALETNYGAEPGSKDVIRSMTTLAALRVRPDLYHTELLAALSLLQTGDVTRAELHGSWAGAMGQPQFMPSSFAHYAIDGDRDGRRDIWTDVPDTLASIANFLAQQGWQTGTSWGVEVSLPPGADPGRSRAPWSEWANRGFRRLDGKPLTGTGEAILFFPAGVDAPAFLVTGNFEVLKTYNFSDAYVLSVGLLADRLQGGTGFVGAWPSVPSMARPARIALQARLAALGFPIDNREGRVGLAQRDVIRHAQARVGQIPDGNPTDALLAALTTLAPAP